jgi:transposase
MKEIFKYELSASMDGTPQLKYKLDETALDLLKSTVLGKTALFTNQYEWSNEEIVAAYRSAWHIEHAFRQMKDTEHLNVRPVYHWTDEKIKVHIFYCVLAYRLCCLLRRELEEIGIHDSMNHILNELNDFKQVTTVFGCNKNDIITSFTQPSQLASSISDKYNFKENYLSTV